MRLNISFTSIWVKLPFYSSNQAEHRLMPRLLISNKFSSNFIINIHYILILFYIAKPLIIIIYLKYSILMNNFVTSLILHSNNISIGKL